MSQAGGLSLREEREEIDGKSELVIFAGQETEQQLAGRTGSHHVLVVIRPQTVRHYPANTTTSTRDFQK